MEDWQKTRITRNLPTLIENTKCNVMLLARLQAKDLLSDHDCEVLVSIPTDLDRSKKLYDIILTRCGAYDILLTALKDTRQSGAYEILKKKTKDNDNRSLVEPMQELALGKNTSKCPTIDENTVFEALATGNLQILSRVCQLYVESGRDITEITAPGKKSLLHYAVSHLKYDVVAWLLNVHNFKTVLSNLRMCDLLHYCIQMTESLSDKIVKEKVRIVETLVHERKELLEAADKHSNTPILSDGKHVDLLIKLIELGANISCSNSRQHTMLHKACKLPSSQYLKLSQFLFKNGHGTAFKARNDYGVTPIHFVVQAQDIPLEILIKLSSIEFNFNDVDKYGNTVLLYAIMGNRSVEFIDVLIEYGANWKLYGSRGRTVLHYAAWHGNVNALKYFLAKGMDINEKCENQNPPLHYAVLDSPTNTLKLESVKFLMDNNADVNARDTDGYTVLHHAVISPNIQFMEVMEYLISVGADINAVDNKNIAVMNRAAEKLNPYQYDSLLQAILKTNTLLRAIPDNKGCTFLHWAVLLMEPLDRTLETFSTHWDINSKDSYNGNSVLFMAIQGKRSEACLNSLIRLGANWNHLNSTNQNALHFAVEAGYLGGVKFFLKKGCNINAKDEKGNTVLHSALSNMIEEQYEIVVELVNNGADLKARNKAFLTCQEYALTLVKVSEVDSRVLRVLDLD
ncbi:unnamed protein product [Orchesella dallaii]|uniref:CARD domain-containing protein n=1 Tax=Orchesella dallaii TaxID=48710 RepID=A0ABP1PQI2_9HEXA